MTDLRTNGHLTVTELAKENQRLRHIVATFANRDHLIDLCKLHISSKHCTLWMDWLVTEGDGLTSAATWLTDQILALMDLTVPSTLRDTPPS